MHVLSWPAYYALELTPDCNNRCPGCSNVYADDRTPPPLSATDWEAVLAHIGPEAAQFRLTGGEPTMHPEFLRILNAATAFDAWVTVFTNGRWSEPEHLVRTLRDTRQLSGLLISLHGATPSSHAAFSGARDSFQETVANIRLAVAHGIPVALSTIITRQNLHEIDAVVDLPVAPGGCADRGAGRTGTACQIWRVHSPVLHAQPLRGLPGRRGLCVNRSVGSHASMHPLANSGWVPAGIFGARIVARPGYERLAAMDATRMHRMRCFLGVPWWLQGHL